MAGNEIPYGRQSICDEDIEAVVEVLRSDWLTQGPTVENFERSVAQYCGARYGVAVNSATSALHIACLAAGLGPGKLLWTSPNTFVASANCALYCGASVNFVDIDPASYNLGTAPLRARLEEAKRQNRLPDVVLPVHFAGQSCEMEEIAALGREYCFKVIEDASHSIGGRYQGSPIGSCCFSEMAVFSFHPVKILTTGEGGMVLTNSSDLYEKLKRLRSHGITREPALMQGATHGPWYYQQVELGFNYRMTDIEAALGLSQLRRLDAFVARRHELARRYNELFRDVPVATPWQHPDSHSAFHLYVLKLKLAEMKKGRLQVFEELREAGIGVNIHYIPVHTQPYYRRLGFAPGDFPESERYYAQAITLPLYFGLSEADQDRIASAVRRAVR